MSDLNQTRPRPLGVAHLIFGLIFTGIAATWIIGKVNDTDVPDLAIGVPIVLIGAGIIGLGASVLNQRRARARLLATTYDAGATTSVETAATTEETTSLTTRIEEDR